MSDQSAYKDQTYCSENQTLGYWFDSDPLFPSGCLESNEIIMTKDYNSLIHCIKQADYYLDGLTPKIRNGHPDVPTLPVNAIQGDQQSLNENVQIYTIIEYIKHFKNIKENLLSNNEIDQNKIIYGMHIKDFKRLLDNYVLDPNLTHKVWVSASCCDPCGGGGDSGGGCGCYWYTSGNPNKGEGACEGSGWWG